MAADENELTAIVREFLIESKENLDHFEMALLELESDPTAERSLQAAFRSVHSIKGCCGFLGFEKIESVTHAGETLMSLVRDGRLTIDRDTTNALLVMVDTLRRILVEIEVNGTEGDMDVAATIDGLSRATYPVARNGGTKPKTAATATTSMTNARPEDLPALAATDNKIRVDTALLERLMNLVGELVLARNQIVQLGAVKEGGTGAAAAQRLSLITSEIQEVAMKTRMQPIGNIWSRFPRMIRELGRTCGKDVRLEMQGQETELDRTLIQAIQDPLTHLVRNAVDHGIEAPAERMRLGKPSAGEVTLHAYHEGGMVNIEISDDGRGLDCDAIQRKAIRKNLVSAEHAASMSERELWNLVFTPGFSTTDVVSHVSGRGVGLDVVKTNIEQIGGTVDLQSGSGRGTTVKIKIPLTLAIIPALIVSNGGERYAIPQANLLEVLRLDADKSKRQIELVQGTPVLRLRGKLLPLAFLGVELGGETDASVRTSPARGDDDTTSIVVLQANERAFGLVVDDIHDTEEIVVKPLWKRLKRLGCYAGATVMGDGRVALILDALGLAQRVGVVRETHTDKRAMRAGTAGAEAEEKLTTRDPVLLCRMGPDGRLAIPLSKVARLEELPLRAIERTGDVEVVQYRSRILPLVRLDRVITERRSRPRGQTLEAPDLGRADSVHVVVYSYGGRSFGLIVDAILDIVDVELATENTGARPGVLGSMVIQGRVTELLDIESAITIANGALLAVERAHPAESFGVAGGIEP